MEKNEQLSQVKDKADEPNKETVQKCVYPNHGKDDINPVDYRQSKEEDHISGGEESDDEEKIREVEEMKRQAEEGREQGMRYRETFGEKNPNKPHKNILLVGETGTGKTSLINALAKYAKGVRFEDEIKLNIVEEQRTSQSESQTSAVTIYDIFPDENSSFPYNLTIIDTPGYGDTKGLEHDKAVSKQLHHFFRSNDSVNELNAVGFVMKATQNRLTDRQRYIFDAVIALFGKDMKKNIVVLLTHSDGGPATNAIQALKDAKIPCAKAKDRDPVHFLFNNRKSVVSEGQEAKKKKEERALSNARETNNEGMKDLFKFLEKTPPQRLVMTADVLNCCIQIEALVTSYQEQIKYIELKQVERRQVEEALKEQKEACSVTVDEPYKDRVPIVPRWFKNVTCCTVCEENCHYPGCTMAPNPKWCKVMRNYHCTSCSGRCHYTKHVKEKWRFVSKTRKVTKKYEDLLKEYKVNSTENEKILLDSVKNSMEEANVKKSQLVEDSYENVLKLQEIALKGGSLSTYLQLDFLIEKLKETGEPDSDQKVQKLMEIKKQVGEENRGGIDYLVKK